MSYLRVLVVALLACAGGAQAIAPSAADALRARYVALGDALAHNQFQRPIALQSEQNSGDLKGDMYAIVDHPFSTLNNALKGADRWCDILMLHLNTKDCRASNAASPSLMAVSIGKKFDQPLADAHRLDFIYRVAAQAADYLQVRLNADAGPLGTRDYRIVLEAVPLDARRSFMHLSYAYGYGLGARLAMQAYLSTAGRDKVGFSIVGHEADGRPVYVGNVRGVIERNTMRYYLAIDAYLSALSSPPQEQTERRLRNWYAAAERYPLQLHEMEEADYLAMKRSEIRRQQAQSRVAAAG